MTSACKTRIDEEIAEAEHRTREREEKRNKWRKRETEKDMRDTVDLQATTTPV